MLRANCSGLAFDYSQCSITAPGCFVFMPLFFVRQTGEGNEGGDKEGADDTLDAMPPKSASQASRSSKASRKKV